MTKFRLVLVLLCLGILGALPFIISQPKPAQQQAMAAPQNADLEWSVRSEVGTAVEQAVRLAEAHEFTEARARLETLRDVPDKTARELTVIRQAAVFVGLPFSFSQPKADAALPLQTR